MWVFTIQQIFFTKPKTQKKKNQKKIPIICWPPCYIYIYTDILKKNYVHTIHNVPTSFLPPVVHRTEFLKDCFLNAHYSPALLERGKGKLNYIAKTVVPVVPSGVVVGLPHYRAGSPSQALLGDIGHPTPMPSLFSPLPSLPPSHPTHCSPTLPLPGVKWREFQPGVNVYSLLGTLKNKNSS